MSGNSVGFGEEINKLCQKVCSVRMLIWSAVDCLSKWKYKANQVQNEEIKEYTQVVNLTYLLIYKYNNFASYKILYMNFGE